jgi:hypothetical protein
VVPDRVIFVHPGVVMVGDPLFQQAGDGAGQGIGRGHLNPGQEEERAAEAAPTGTRHPRSSGKVVLGTVASNPIGFANEAVLPKTNWFYCKSNWFFLNRIDFAQKQLVLAQSNWFCSIPIGFVEIQLTLHQIQLDLACANSFRP